MIRLPGVGSLVLDAIYEGRWREAGRIATSLEAYGRVHLEDPRADHILICLFEGVSLFSHDDIECSGYLGHGLLVSGSRVPLIIERAGRARVGVAFDCRGSAIMISHLPQQQDVTPGQVLTVAVGVEHAD